MNPQEPVVPEPDVPVEPGGPVSDPRDARAAGRVRRENEDERLDDYDEADAESFPASDPPAACARRRASA